MQDSFRWAAVYKDGTVKYQVDPITGHKMAYADIDRKNLKFFHMVPVGAIEPYLSIDFSEGDGEKLVWTRRVQMRNEGGKTTRVGKVYILGKKGRFIIVLHEDGSTQIVNNFDEKNPLIYPIEEKK